MSTDFEDDIFQDKARVPRSNVGALQRMKSIRRARIKEGLCGACGNPLSEGYQYLSCEDCRKSTRERWRRKNNPELAGAEITEDKTKASVRAIKSRLKKRNSLDRLPGRNALTPRTGDTWTAEEKELLKEFFSKREPLENICIRLGRSPYAIFRYGRRLGIPDCDPNNLATPYLADRMRYW